MCLAVGQANRNMLRLNCITQRQNLGLYLAKFGTQVVSQKTRQTNPKVRRLRQEKTSRSQENYTRDKGWNARHGGTKKKQTREEGDEVQVKLIRAGEETQRHRSKRFYTTKRKVSFRTADGATGLRKEGETNLSLPKTTSTEHIWRRGGGRYGYT